jgi:hypothetical protein
MVYTQKVRGSSPRAPTKLPCNRPARKYPPADQSRATGPRAVCYRVLVLPEFNSAGDLPAGIHRVDLQALLAVAMGTCHLERVFLWGSFVTAKPSPGDLDVLLIMDETFEVDQAPPEAHAVFDSGRAKLLFEADVFWARVSIGDDVLRVWLDTYQISRECRKRGIVELEFS